jgi:hypothetical protein
MKMRQAIFENCCECVHSMCEGATLFDPASCTCSFIESSCTAKLQKDNDGCLFWVDSAVGNLTFYDVSAYEITRAAVPVSAINAQAGDDVEYCIDFCRGKGFCNG